MNRPFIVAELGANHLGSIERAHRIIDAAAAAGADAVKLQTFTPEQMVAAELVLEAGPWAGRRAVELYQEAHTLREWHAELFTHIREAGMVAFSSVFHPDDVDFLEQLDCPIYKIASFELTELDLIRYTAVRGKPMIISTGMGTIEEIYAAMNAAREFGAGQITLLKCTSAYPAPIEDCNLLGMGMLHYAYCDIGLSDHTPGIGVSVAAAALGASVIEKHLTLARADGGPDAAFSMEPAEFAQLVTECRRAAAARGIATLGPVPSEASSLALRRPPAGRRGDKA